MVTSCGSLKRILYPVYVAIAGNGNHVKTDRAICFLGGKINMGCRDDAGLFSSGDAFNCTAVFIGFAESDFDNNQRLFIGHD